MRRVCLFLALAAGLAALPQRVSAQPQFVNGLKFPGNTHDATHEAGAAGRFGFFSDIYFDPNRNEWWALSDRGPGGGVLSYETRLSRFDVDINPLTGRISNMRVKETIRFTDPRNLLDPHTGVKAPLNGLNPKLLRGNVGILGRSFDPEGLVIDPRTGHFLIADEYGPSLFEFDRKGRLVKIFETPANLIPRTGGIAGPIDYVAIRDEGNSAGRQDNRGFEGLAISPDGKTLYAVLQDPLVNEGGNTPAGDNNTSKDNNGRNGQYLRIVVFDNDRHSATYGFSTRQLAYPLEAQADVRARILAAQNPPANPPTIPVDATATDPRQGRNIGLSAIAAINDHEFLVLERDNRGIGVDDPNATHTVGSKRIYKIDIDGATNIADVQIPDNGLGGIIPVTKSAVFIDIQLNTILPNGKQIEKWEGMAIGPRLWTGGYLMLFGNDNDYSVSQDVATTKQYDIYVDYNGHNVRRDFGVPTTLDSVDVGAPPAGYSLLPGVLHAYRASRQDLAGYERPEARGFDRDHDCDRDDDHDWRRDFFDWLWDNTHRDRR